MRTLVVVMALCVCGWMSSLARSQSLLNLQQQFSTNGGIGLAFDPINDRVITYGSDTMRFYSRMGTLLNTISDAPGESADDADIDVADVALTLGTTAIPVGTVLFTNGETDTAEIYALSPNGDLIATLNTSFGNSHVVGCAYHPQRGTFFMVQDRVPSNPAIDNVVAEVDPVSGAVLNQFDLNSITPDFTVNFGDLDVCRATGNLLIASSDEDDILEISPEGVEQSRWTIASGSGGSLSVSGIAMDDARNEIFSATTGGTVYRFSIARSTSHVSSYVYHAGWSGPGALQWTAIDSTKAPASPGVSMTELSLDNLINTAHGINGLVLDIFEVGDVENIVWSFQWSPTGVFDLNTNPPSSWAAAPAPASIAKFAGQGFGNSDRLLLVWPNNSIANRWLRVQADIGTFSQAYFLGHLRGETSGLSGGIYMVAFEDIVNIRMLAGTNVDSGSEADINKDGLVSLADISAMRSSVGTQLTNSSIP